MVNFFSLIIPVVLLVPNMLFFILKPRNVLPKKENSNKEKVFTIFERIGQAGIFTLPIFYKINISSPQYKATLIAMVFSLLVYYGCWLRFFMKQRDYSLLFKPLWILPIPMAVLPILYMFLGSIILNSKLLLLATLLLSIGHLPISYNEYKYTSKVNMQ